MSVLFPHRRRSRLFVALLLVDLAVLAAAVVASLWLGFGRTVGAVTVWRVEHPWSLLVSAVAAVLLVVRWERRS